MLCYFAARQPAVVQTGFVLGDTAAGRDVSSWAGLMSSLLQCGPQVVLRQRKQMYVHLQTGVGRAEIQMVQDSSLGVSY